MFLGHFAVALTAAGRERRLRLGTAMVAAQWPDSLWPALLLAGIERVSIVPGDTAFTPLRFDHYPWSHSLVAVAAWSVLFGALMFTRTRSRSTAAVAGALVISHWVLDVITHRPDVPVGLDGPMLGLGLWNSVAATVVVESLMFAAGVFYYARRRTAGFGFWALIATLVAIDVANILGPPPPSVTAIAVSCLVLIPVIWFWGNRVSGAEQATA
jgi:membrane-bound metal-dependent hydrolase YbcI (DUF457 family)